MNDLQSITYNFQKNLQRLKSFIPSPSQILPKRGYIKVMLIIDSKDCENIDKALKKYKKKYEKSRTLNQLRERQAFTKPSVKRRTEVLKTVYKQQLLTRQIH